MFHSIKAITAPFRAGLHTQSFDFRRIGTEKNAGALQDLLRRVMEIDADITNTPIAEFKPNTMQCNAFCVADHFDLTHIPSRLEQIKGFNITSQLDGFVSVLDQEQGGDMYMFSNGTFVSWGIDSDRQQSFLDTFVQMSDFKATTETVEYTIDEDEVTDIKGNVILLNPYMPSIELSKTAFSYGLGRSAKLKSIEMDLEDHLAQLSGVPASFSDDTQKHTLSRVHISQLFRIRQRMMYGSNDGFLGTADFHWARPELEAYVDKISKQFNVRTRIETINKKIDYANDLLSTAKAFDLFM
ncbi:uncharacterized protein B0P05DRAFT_543495 [Gilbertella persicaria]|uniref:uncharacterized protein n=1 Tax=Gilbertella persicaria TaxID=101096 RepID=UPI00221EF900|nr:uncharacterized protein B0P05DRAFT_543495 [Gilbertella persicaria]KAI8077958.1 hypothetical protein B0P05DRAFT_543495 [Gilbertella persicaria]